MRRGVDRHGSARHGEASCGGASPGLARQEWRGLTWCGEAGRVDAVQQNAAHGRHLDRMDRTRSVMMLQSHGFTHEKIAFAIQVPEKQVMKYAIKIATVPKSSVDAIPGTQSISLKRPVLHMAGKTLTKAQAEAHRILPGTSFLLIAKQLCAGLSQNMVNLEDHKLVDQLIVLRDLLIEKING